MRRAVGRLVVVVAMLVAVGPVGEVPARANAARPQADGVERLVVVPWAGAAPNRETGIATRSRREALDNETRAAVYDAVVAVPGIHLAGVAERAGVAQSTTRYHVHVLERADLLVSEARWGKRRLFPASLSADQRPAAAAAVDPTLGPVLDAVADTDPATVSALAAELARAPSTVSHHLATLAAAGLVERERDGEHVVSHLSAAVTER